MTDGTLSVRRRDPKATELAAAESKRNALTTGAFEYFADFEASFDAIGQGNQGRKTKKPEPAGEVDEMKVEKIKRRKLQPYDKFLKSFQYGAALDAVMKPVCDAGSAWHSIAAERITSRTHAQRSHSPSFRSSPTGTVSARLFGIGTT